MTRPVNTILAISIIVILAVVIGGIIWWQFNQQAEEISPANEQTQGEQNGQEQTELAGWKTYNYSSASEYSYQKSYASKLERYLYEIKYEIKYPDGWYVKEAGAGAGPKSVYFSDKDSKLAPCGEFLEEERPKPGCEAYIFIHSDRFPVEQSSERFCYADEKYLTNLSKKIIQIGDYAACQMSGTWTESAAFPKNDYLRISSDLIGKKFIDVIPITNAWRIKLMYLQKDKEDYSEIFNRMLSSLKLDVKPPIPLQ